MNVLADLHQRVQSGLIERTEIRTLVLPSALMDQFRESARQREAHGQPARSADEELEMWIMAHALADHQGGLPHEVYPFPKRGSGSRGTAR